MEDSLENSFDYKSFDLDGLSERNKKLLTDEVKKMYNNENNSENNPELELEKIKELAKKINDDEESFCKMGIFDQSKMLFENDKVKSSILGLSLTNCCYSFLHLGQTILNFKTIEMNEFNLEYEEIKKNFEKHKNEIPLISEDDIDKAIEQIIDAGKKFQQDLDDITDLIKKIQLKINSQENELIKTKMNIAVSIAGAAISFFVASSVEKKKDYKISGGANALGIIGNVIEIGVQQKDLKNSNEILEKAKQLKNDIIKEIDKLKEKFAQLSVKHFS